MVKNYLQLGELFLGCSGINDDIIQVDEGKRQVQLTQVVSREPLEAGALQRPYGIQRNSYTPMLSSVEAVYYRESGRI